MRQLELEYPIPMLIFARTKVLKVLDSFVNILALCGLEILVDRCSLHYLDVMGDSQ